MVGKREVKMLKCHPSIRGVTWR